MQAIRTLYNSRKPSVLSVPCTKLDTTGGTRVVCSETRIARLSTIQPSHLSILLYNCDKEDIQERES